MQTETLPRADLGKRFLAFVIDGVLILGVNLIPIVGQLAAMVYALTRDSIVYTVTRSEDYRNRSVGKRVMGLKVVRLSGPEDVDTITAVKRNFVLIIGTLMLALLGPVVLLTMAVLLRMVPGSVSVAISDLAQILIYLGLAATVALTLVALPVEAIIVLVDRSGRRLGDRIAGTHVVED